MNKVAIIILGFSVMANSIQAAETLPIKPGLWEMTATTTNPFLGSRTHTSQECMKEFNFDPKEMMEGMPKDACEVNTNVSGNTMTYDMSCDMQGNQMTGNGTFTVDGDTAKGQMTMQSQVSGQNIEMTMVSEGKRVGDC